jgi:hypothetical protein
MTTSVPRELRCGSTHSGGFSTPKGKTPPETDGASRKEIGRKRPQRKSAALILRHPSERGKTMKKPASGGKAAARCDRASRRPRSSRRITFLCTRRSLQALEPLASQETQRLGSSDAWRGGRLPRLVGRGRMPLRRIFSRRRELILCTSCGLALRLRRPCSCCQ